jgi:hypothetical protein
VREDSDRTQKERQKVPISYAPKEKFLTRLQADPTLTKSIATTLPRMSFEMQGMSYDQTRKQQSLIKHRSSDTVNASSLRSQYMGVPYDFDFGLSIYVRNIEDGLQIVEQILPFFTPDFTVSAQVSEDIGIIKDIPIILKSVTEKIDYEGAFQDGTRMITWDLTFTLKGFLFGPVANTAIIQGVVTGNTVGGGVYVNLYQDINNKTIQKIMLTGGTINYQDREPIRSPERDITGVVYAWYPAANTLYLSGMTGVLRANDHVWGLQSGAHWTVQSLDTIPLRDAEIHIVQNPISANQSSDYGYTTYLTEFPDTLI